MKVVPIVYFSDVLRVRAYIVQARLDEVRAQFGDRVDVETRFCSVLGDTARKMRRAIGLSARRARRRPLRRSATRSPVGKA